MVFDVVLWFQGHCAASPREIELGDPLLGLDGLGTEGRLLKGEGVCVREREAPV
jgi:hypothetical protein